MLTGQAGRLWVSHMFSLPATGTMMPCASSDVLSTFAVHCATWFMQRLHLTNLSRLLQSLLLVVGPVPQSMLDANHTTVSLSELVGLVECG